MSILPPYGMPGVGSTRQATHRCVFRGDVETYLPGGKVIDGSKSRDPNNSPVTVLQAGVLMGKITASGLYAPSILGVTTGAYTSGGTSLTVSAAQAAEIVRRVGSSGTATLKAVAPPTAAGTNASTAVTFSAINTTTGVLTVTSLGVDKVAGTMITAADGSEVPLTFITDGYGVRVVDMDGTSINVPFPLVPIAGVIYSSKIINWPSDTSLQAYIVASVNAAAAGKFVWDHAY